MVFLFLIFSFKVSVSVFNYWLKKKAELTLIERNLDVGFNWRSGELTVKADYLYLENPNFSAEFSRPEVEISLYRSLRELRPVVSYVGFSEGKVVVKREEKKSGGKLEIPPVPETVNVGRFVLIWPKGELQVNRFVVEGERFFCGGVLGSYGNRRFYVEPFGGYRQDKEVVVPQISAGFDGVRVLGKLSFSGVDRWLFVGSVFSSPFSGEVIVKNYGKLNVRWRGKAKELPTEGDGVLEVGKGEVRVESLKGELDGAKFSVRGLISERLDLAGTVEAVEFIYNKTVKLERLKGRLEVSGYLKSPVVTFRGSAERVDSPLVDVSEVKFNGALDKRGGELRFSSESISGKLALEFKERGLSGSLKLKDFSVDRFKPVLRFRERYGEWIPGVVISGNVRFKLKESKLSYSGKFSLGKFQFQGFEGTGELSFSGNRKRLEFKGTIEGEGGKVTGEGSLYLKERKVEASLTALSIPLEKFSFLSKVGLSGRVNGEGKIWGSLVNPSGEFSVSSRNVSFCGVSLGETEGEIYLKDFSLRAEAVTEKGDLEQFSLSLRGRLELLAEGKVQDVTGKEVERILNHFGVRLPVALRGTGSGWFRVASSNLKERGNLQLFVRVGEFSGEVRKGELTLKGTGSGNVEYTKGRLSVDLKGKLENLVYGDKLFSGGNYSFNVEGKRLEVTVRGIHYRGLSGLKNEISGRALLDLKDGSLEGRGEFRGEYRRGKEFEVTGGVGFVFSGFLSDFTVKFSGKLKLNSAYSGEKVVDVEGQLIEPENLGMINLKGNGLDLKLIANGREWQAVGFVRDAELKFPKVRVRINMAFVNVNLNRLSGNVAVPTFRVYPQGFYPLYSVSGLYINLEKGKVEVSNISLSYLDGWIKIKDVKLNRGVRGEFEGELGLKGLIYLIKAQKFVPYARNSIAVKGGFDYEGELHYRAELDGSGVEFKARYLLDRAVINSLRAVVEDGTLLTVKGELSTGGGNVLLSGNQEKLSLTASLVPVGEVGRWKGLISGKVNYSEDRLVGTLTVSKAKVFLSEERKGGRGEEGSVKVPVKVAVNVLFDQPLKIKGELFSLTLVPKLWIRTVQGKLVIGATFYVTDGKINYMGKVFKIIYGSGTIEDLERQRGRVSILASAYVSGYYIYMKIEGELNNLTIYLSSDPPLTREQILNLIMTGASPEEIEASSELFPAVQVAYYATASLFKPFEAKFKKTLKLESFSIEPYITKYGETVAKLTVAKRLAKRIRLVGYGTTGQNPEYGGSIQIFLNKNYYLELRYNSYYGPEAGIGLEVNRK